MTLNDNPPLNYVGTSTVVASMDTFPFMSGPLSSCGMCGRWYPWGEPHHCEGSVKWTPTVIAQQPRTIEDRLDAIESLLKRLTEKYLDE